MTRKTKIAIGVLAGLGILIVGLAPFTLMLLPTPMPVPVRNLADEPPGAFVTSGSVTLKVFPRPEPAQSFPLEGATTDPGARVLVKYRQLDGIDSYSLNVFPDGAAVPVLKDTVQPGVLELRPKGPLAPGFYVVQYPRDGLEGGTDYIYFRVRPAPASDATTSSSQLE